MSLADRFRTPHSVIPTSAPIAGPHAWLQRFFGAGIVVRRKAAALEQSFDPVGDQSRHFHHFSVFRRGQLMQFRLAIGSRRVNPVDNDAVKVRGEP
jgi:hypothetical protein